MRAAALSLYYDGLSDQSSQTESVFIFLSSTDELEPLLELFGGRVVLRQVTSQVRDLQVVVAVGRIAAIDPVWGTLQQLLGRIET
jgi:hypothetical protein